MEWHFTRTEADLRAGILAQVQTPGTQVRAAYRRTLLLTALLLAVLAVLLFFSSPVWARRPGMYALVWALALAMVVPSLLPRAYARRTLRAFKRGHKLDGLLGPCTAGLDGAFFYATDSDLVQSQAQWRCPLQQITGAVLAGGGVLLLFANGRAYFFPPSAFNAAQSMPACVQLFNQAMAAARQNPAWAPPPPAAQAPAPQPGYFATPQGGVLHFVLTEEQVRLLLRQLTGAVYRMPATWLRQWRTWLVYAAATVIAGVFYWPLALLLVGIVVGGMAWNVLHPRGIEALLGPQTLELNADGVRLVRGDHAWAYAYTAYERLLETADGLFLYSARSGAALVIPKAAFADGAQQAAFVDCVARHMPK